jgi:hypothetical protein
VHSSELCPMQFQGQKSIMLTLSCVISLKVPLSWNYNSGYDSKSICASFNTSPAIFYELPHAANAAEHVRVHK